MRERNEPCADAKTRVQLKADASGESTALPLSSVREETHVRKA